MITKLKAEMWSFLWLFAGMVCGVFSNGRWIVPIAIWIGLVFLLRFVRLQSPAKAFFILAPAVFIVFAISWKRILVTTPDSYFLIAFVAVFESVGDAFAWLCALGFISLVTQKLVLMRIMKG